jgi:tripartite-type tricarboxylate transporter receptor subunit TctC
MTSTRKPLANVIGGQIPATVQTAPGVIAALRGGRVRRLAVTSSTRLTQLPDVPTMSESALPGFEVNSWWGLCAPAATPAAILDKLHADLTAVLRMPEIEERLKDLIVNIATNSKEQFAEFLRAEKARWARVIEGAKIPKQ